MITKHEDILNRYGLMAYYASSPADMEDALDLLSKSFPGKSYYDTRKSMSFYLQNVTELHCLLIKHEERVVGVQCILDRKLNYFGIECNVGGMSYAAIDPLFQNSNVGKLIKEIMFEYFQDKTDFSLGFARKAIDNYWYPYGYRGITNFCEISLPFKSISVSESAIQSKKMSEEHIPEITNLYDQVYSGLLGPFKRDWSLWNYYIKKCTSLAYHFKVMYSGENLIGYYIKRGNTFFEVAYDKKQQNEVFKYLVYIIKTEGYSEAKFMIGKNHCMITHLSRYEHSVSTRYVWRGGHILKIHNVFAFLKKIKGVLEFNLNKIQIPVFTVKCNHIKFTYNGTNLVIEMNPSDNPDFYFDEPEWSKLIFGVVPAHCLIGFKGEGNIEILQILFPVHSPQFLEIDNY